MPKEETLFASSLHFVSELSGDVSFCLVFDLEGDISSI